MQTYTTLPLTCNQSCWGFWVIKASNHSVFLSCASLGSSRLLKGLCGERRTQRAARHWKQPKSLSDTHLSFIWFSKCKKHKPRARLFTPRRSTPQNPTLETAERCSFLLVFWRDVDSLSHLASPFGDEP